VDMFKDMLSVVHSVLAVEATFDDLTDPINVIDKTEGVELQPGENVKVQTILPACVVQGVDLTEMGLTPAILVGRFITFNAKRWKIINHKSRPTPEGEDSGEFYLFLRKPS
jgi:hypothetical protein